jgi:predicted amidophosphoribosyltransferase
MEGKTSTVESLADRYNQGSASVGADNNQNATSDDTKFCAFCGKKIPTNAEFCSYCGKSVSGT